MFNLSTIAVFDSIPDPKPVAYINKHLRIWLHHQANNPSEDSLHLETIAAQVRSKSPQHLLSTTLHL
jgi:hypothetical protein